MNAVLPIMGLGKLAAGTGAGWLRLDGRGTTLNRGSVGMIGAGCGNRLMGEAIDPACVVRWWLLPGWSCPLCIQAASLLSAGLGGFPDEKFQFRDL